MGSSAKSLDRSATPLPAGTLAVALPLLSLRCQLPRVARERSASKKSGVPKLP